ncbi:unnamed protein product [Symbiodinium necroappetens]|uniref:Uncharacterized protein n=1 Tax=Symbiodinium necroappetens TaxID=1628268 RepID=A0A812PB83_9DINO|nr:unnamed protein product [Symbiodinium necroappetens]
MKHKEDYLLFWADEHTHFNYAMQWFGMGTLMMVMTFYKFVEVSRLAAVSMQTGAATGHCKSKQAGSAIVLLVRHSQEHKS